MTTNVSLMKIDEKSFQRISSYITHVYGIKLPPQKKTLLETRLHKYISTLGYTSFAAFVGEVFKKGHEADILKMVDLVTTNKTDFFREVDHFTFLEEQYLPWFVKQKREPLLCWSAACSSGEEPYTLAMVLEEYRKKSTAFPYQIFCSDISIRMLQAAFDGIYAEEKTYPIKTEWKKRYFLRSKDEKHRTLRAKKVLREKMQFYRINLKAPSDYRFKKDYFHMIFCRNVLIYFDKALQEQVIRRLTQHLRPGGILFLGHSESILGMDVPLKQVYPAVYQKQF